MDKKIGFIGLGEMGKWMALNIVKAGYDVSVHDIDPDAVRFVADQGARGTQRPGGNRRPGRLDLYEPAEYRSRRSCHFRERRHH